MKLILCLTSLVILISGNFGKICPDQKSRCPSSATCCQTSSGYGCCPYEDATCCMDELHCCPSHLQCDVTHSRCVSSVNIPFPFSNALESGFQEPLLPKMLQVDITKKTCPDGQQKCPESYTCCKLNAADGYACCPETDAVCCSDGVHCCPKGTKCNVKSGSCDRT